VAESYDVMNDLMSAGVHRWWKDELIRELKPTPSMRLLDMAGGTGDISFRFLDALAAQYGSAAISQGLEGGGVTISDINKDMLAVGRTRYEERYGSQYGAVAGVYQSGVERPSHSPVHTETINFVVADAMELPYEDNSFDAYTISFGLRNVTDMDQAMREAHRVLKPGGRMLIMEFSHVNNPLLALTYNQYSSAVIPEIGHMVANDRDSYQYLIESIRNMPDQRQLAKRVSEAGFEQVSYRDLTFGVVAMHSGFKL